MHALISTPANKEIHQTIIIETGLVNYPLHLDSEGDKISFTLEYNSANYKKKISLKEIKDQESIAIFLSYKPKDFIEFLKKLSEMKKIVLIQKDSIISLKFELEVMFKKHEIEIELTSNDKNSELIEKELKELKEENKELKIRIENLENEVKEIKKILNPGFNINRIKMGNKSVIMKENEFDLIHLAIKSRINLEVKELKKLYQATIDGGGAINFHSRCDNIPNTLVLIKSAGNRRFGGFTTAQWSSPSEGEFNDDPDAFLFSLDKKTIYSYNKNGNAIYNNKNSGPCFGYFYSDIGIPEHCLEKKNYNTRVFMIGETKKSSYKYYGDKNPLYEGDRIHVAELEVFQVIF